MDADWKRQIDRSHAALVRRDDPAEWVTEADAVDAMARYPQLRWMGPVFGLAGQDSSAGPWRVVRRVIEGTPQQARDELNSLLWFKAKDDVDEPGMRRELLAAVAMLEREPVNEVEALGVRYRVVRADALARSGKDGLEPPRPTDPEPADRSWEGQFGRSWPDDDFVLDPDRDDGFTAGALKLGLQDFVYSDWFADDVREDSQRAVAAYPHVALLPVLYGVVERKGRQGWEQHGSSMPTPHDARRLLYSAMAEIWPLVYQFSQDEKEEYAQAAEEFRSARCGNEAGVGERLFRIHRVERAMRWGSDGPETPRPSDRDDHGPSKMHPTMDEDGTIHHDA